MIVNSGRDILFALQFQWDGSEIINSGISDFMWICISAVFPLVLTITAIKAQWNYFIPKLLGIKFFFNMKQYLHFSWGNIILNHAQSQGLHQRSLYVSAGTSTSDVSFPCWGSSPHRFPHPAHWVGAQGTHHSWALAPGSSLAADQPRGTASSECFTPACTQIAGSASQGFEQLRVNTFYTAQATTLTGMLPGCIFSKSCLHKALWQLTTIIMSPVRNFNTFDIRHFGTLAFKQFFTKGSQQS